MPPSRWFVKRDLDHALTHVTRIEDYLVRSGRLYEANHPRPYEMFCVLVVMAQTLRTGIEDLKGHL